MLQVVKGRLVSGFDGTITDRQTGEVKNYNPSLTFLNEETFEQFKVKVTKEVYDQYSVMIGQEFTIRGSMTKPAQPAVFNGVVTPNKEKAKAS